MKKHTLTDELNVKTCPHCGASPAIFNVANKHEVPRSGDEKDLWYVYKCKECGCVTTAVSDAVGGTIDRTYPSIRRFDWVAIVGVLIATYVAFGAGYYMWVATGLKTKDTGEVVYDHRTFKNSAEADKYFYSQAFVLFPWAPRLPYWLNGLLLAVAIGALGAVCRHGIDGVFGARRKIFGPNGALLAGAVIGVLLYCVVFKSPEIYLPDVGRIKPSTVGIMAFAFGFLTSRSYDRLKKKLADFAKDGPK